ncbi:thioredoxin fold domain-containing protein [Ampullimonas aquatilis]|uniref:thioredoxin fold domain-containing protein n=1 Tax=Ampullimonas aquatilis TaxID=1341549 RepID=UPI003C78D920
MRINQPLAMLLQTAQSTLQQSWRKACLGAGLLLAAQLVQADVASVNAKLQDSPLKGIYTGSVVKETVIKGIYSIGDERGKYASDYINDDFTLYRDARGWRKGIKSADAVLLPAEQATLLKTLYQSIDLSQAIQYKYGKGERQLVLISAVDCGYCKALQANLKKAPAALNAIIYIYPMALHYDVASQAKLVKTVWCQPNAAQAFDETMTDPAARSKWLQASPPADCKNKSEADTRVLAELFKLKGTPSIILPNGELAVGAETAEEIMALLDKQVK